MAEKKLNTILRLKYDTLEAWQNAPEYCPRLGEVCIVEVPTKGGDIQQAPAILFKVGDNSKRVMFAKDGDTTRELPWVSGLAADVYDWAKGATKPTYVASEISGIDAYIKDYVETDMGISVDTDTHYQIVKGNDDYTYLLQSKEKAATTWTTVSTVTIPNDEAAIAQALADAKTYADGLNTAMNTRVAALEAKLGEGEGSVAELIAAAVKAEADRAKAAEKVNADAITAIKDGASIDSFADVESALAGKQAAGDYATNTALANGLATKVDKKTGYSLVEDTEIARLAGVHNYDDTEVRGLIADNAAAIGDANSGLVKAVADVKTTADKAAEDIAALGNTYATITELNKTNEAVTNLQTNSATKTELTDGLATKADKTAFEAIETKVNNFFAEDAAVNDVIDTLVEITNYIANDKEGAADISSRLGTLEGKVDVAKVSEAIAAAVKGEADRATEAEGNLEDRIEVIENAGYATTGEVATAKGEAIEAATTKANTAESNAKAYTDTEIGKVNTEVAKKANDADLAAIAKTGNVNDLVQTDGDVLVLFGGNASGWTDKEIISE